MKFYHVAIFALMGRMNFDVLQSVGTLKICPQYLIFHQLAGVMRSSVLMSHWPAIGVKKAAVCGRVCVMYHSDERVVDEFLKVLDGLLWAFGSCVFWFGYQMLWKQAAD